MTDPLVAESCHTTACRSGVVRYMAPEQVNPGLFGSEARNPQKAIDVHSFAMTAYEVRLPYAIVNGDVMPLPIGPHRNRTILRNHWGGTLGCTYH